MLKMGTEESVRRETDEVLDHLHVGVEGAWIQYVQWETQNTIIQRVWECLI